MNCTLAELGERMSAQEFGLWSTFLENEPMGPASMLAMLAEVLAALANGPLRAPKGRGAFRAADFLDATRWQPAAAAALPAEMTAHDITAMFKPG
jgi:hypothetical protein